MNNKHFSALMESRGDNMIDNDAGLERVKGGKYAFFMEVSLS
jgi:hypothetical protein